MAGPQLAPPTGRRSLPGSWKHTISHPLVNPKSLKEEKVPRDPNSIEHIVEQLLDSSISEQEIMEYQMYVNYYYCYYYFGKR